LQDPEKLEFQPISSDRWTDLEIVLGDRGGWQGCWCMRWRLPRARFESQKGDANKQALRRGIESDVYQGLLAYRNGEPVAWCSLGPREDYPALDDTDVLARVDYQSVWSITCVHVAKRHRRQGISVALIRAAVEYAKNQGAAIVEAYPVIMRGPRIPVAAAMTGFHSAFVAAGFTEAMRRVDVRPIMRFLIDHQSVDAN